MEGNEVQMRQAPVWDILNAGPFHRFTVQGLLAHNCIDYADNLGPLDPSQTRRDQINMTWDALSALRMTRHCLLITATQADSASFNKPLLDKSNFSEDRRKLDHVTGMVSINMLPKEREQGTCRLSWAALREGDMSHLQVVHVAMCLGLSCPLVRATF